MSLGCGVARTGDVVMAKVRSVTRGNDVEGKLYRIVGDGRLLGVECVFSSRFLIPASDSGCECPSFDPPLVGSLPNLRGMWYRLVWNAMELR